MIKEMHPISDAKQFKGGYQIGTVINYKFQKYMQVDKKLFYRYNNKILKGKDKNSNVLMEATTYFMPQCVVTYSASMVFIFTYFQDLFKLFH